MYNVLESSFASSVKTKVLPARLTKLNVWPFHMILDTNHTYQSLNFSTKNDSKNSPRPEEDDDRLYETVNKEDEVKHFLFWKLISEAVSNGWLSNYPQVNRVKSASIIWPNQDFLAICAAVLSFSAR